MKSNTMQFEKTPVKQFVRRKFATKLTSDINKLSTYRVLMHLYKRHETGILYTLLLASWTIGCYKALA